MTPLVYIFSAVILWTLSSEVICSAPDVVSLSKANVLEMVLAAPEKCGESLQSMQQPRYCVLLLPAYWPKQVPFDGGSETPLSQYATASSRQSVLKKFCNEQHPYSYYISIEGDNWERIDSDLKSGVSKLVGREHSHGDDSAVLLLYNVVTGGFDSFRTYSEFLKVLEKVPDKAQASRLCMDNASSGRGQFCNDRLQSSWGMQLFYNCGLVCVSFLAVVYLCDYIFPDDDCSEQEDSFFSKK